MFQPEQSCGGIVGRQLRACSRHLPYQPSGDLQYVRAQRSEEGAIASGSPNRQRKEDSSLASPMLTMRSPSFRVVARGNVAIDAPALQELKLLSGPLL